MIGFDDSYCCLCNIFTIEFLFLTRTQVQLHVDGVPIGEHAAPEVIDDWALHSVAGLQSTKLVVGACWMGKYRLGVCWMGKYRLGVCWMGKYRPGLCWMGKYRLGVCWMGKYRLGMCWMGKYRLGLYWMGKYRLG